MYGGHYQREDRRVMGKSQEWRLGNVEEEYDGAYRLSLSCLSGGDLVKVHSHKRSPRLK